MIQPKWTLGNKLKRFEFYKHLLDGKTILDIGCVNGYRKQDWLHKQIREIGLEVLGMDIDEQSISQIRETHGIDIRHGDAQKFELNRTFQVIHAGELIEHLDCPSGFLKSAKRHMDQSSLLILSTPNAYRVVNFVYNIFSPIRVNSQHTCWYCEHTLTNLLTRSGFEVIQLDYITHDSHSWIRKALSSLVRIFLPKRLAWNTLIVFAQLNPGPQERSLN